MNELSTRSFSKLIEFTNICRFTELFAHKPRLFAPNDTISREITMKGDVWLWPQLLIKTLDKSSVEQRDNRGIKLFHLYVHENKSLLYYDTPPVPFLFSLAFWLRRHSEYLLLSCDPFSALTEDPHLGTRSSMFACVSLCVMHVCMNDNDALSLAY